MFLRIRKWWSGQRIDNTGLATIYYVSGTGHDDNDGTHPLHAWRTMARLNQAKMKIKRNDQILFQRGFTYVGRPFYLDSPRHHGLKIGAFGSGQHPRFSDVEKNKKKV